MSTSEIEVKTGFVYDDIMTQHKDPSGVNHVENPARISSIYETLCKSGYMDRLVRIPARAASVEELCLVHTEQHVREVEGYRSSVGLSCLIPETFPTYVCDHSYETAATAAGACLNLVDAVLTNRVHNGFALVRPPGHHAEKDTTQGFCFFNNVAIAARHIQRNHGDQVKKILIFDWDIHHGNGTQHEFYDEDDVLYVSIHRYDNGKYYPHLAEGDFKSTGSGRGKGFNVNIPWSGDKMGNAEYLEAFDQVVVPIVKAFQADILLVSAGFDASENDPLGEYHVSPEAYGHMTRQLLNLTNGRVVLILEGGYDIEAMTDGVTNCLQALLNDKDGTEIKVPYPDSKISPGAKKILNDVKSELGKYWSL